MRLEFDESLDVLRAVGEATRLRIVVLLAQGELTVTDLTEILGQSQPRISRHLKLLLAAGVVERHREGGWVYFHLGQADAVRHLVDQILASISPIDPVTATDTEHLAGVRERRSLAAQEYFAGIAATWDEVRSLHASEAAVEAAIVATLADESFASILDIGTGTGRMLELLATRPGVERAVGLDSSHSMLAVARANLARRDALTSVELRQGDVYQASTIAGVFDLVVIHQVLHFLDEPARAVEQAARMVAPGGRLVVVDFAPHELSFLQADHAHRRLGFRADTVAGWMLASGLGAAIVEYVAPPADRHLTVTIWVAAAANQPARQPARQSADHPADARVAQGVHR